MYDIAATTGSGGKIEGDQLKGLPQSLLADRFQLKVHWETREAPVYALLVDKDGAKIHQSAGEQEPGINTSKTPGKARMKGTREPIALLAGNLGNQLGRLAIDRTGLHGTYDWLLEWNPDESVESSAPSLLVAVQEQLGLRLEAQKGPMEVLVIDRLERPSEN